MINLAVIELKDILKYIIKITIVILIVVGLTKYFSSFKTKINLDKASFLSCLDTVIPSIKNVNKKDKSENNKNKVQPLKLALGVELGMMDSVQKDEEEKDNSTKLNENDLNKEEEIKEAETGVKTEVVKNSVPEKFTSQYNGVKIRNETDNIKLTTEMLKPNVDVNAKNLLIYHTHSCESYTQTEKYKYKASGNFRTLDTNYSVVRVGTELTKYMKHYGYNVIHDTTLYDYPSYNESYDRSLKGVAKLLEKNKDTDILFDIHRDAIGDSKYAPTVKIGEDEVAQMMFVIGSNGGGSKHDNWNKNLKLAVKIQEKANELYPRFI